jgi:hypothetical protein
MKQGVRTVPWGRVNVLARAAPLLALTANSNMVAERWTGWFQVRNAAGQCEFAPG